MIWTRERSRSLGPHSESPGQDENAKQPTDLPWHQSTLVSITRCNRNSLSLKEIRLWQYSVLIPIYRCHYYDPKWSGQCMRDSRKRLMLTVRCYTSVCSFRTPLSSLPISTIPAYLYHFISDPYFKQENITRGILEMLELERRTQLVRWNWDAGAGISELGYRIGFAAAGKPICVRWNWDTEADLLELGGRSWSTGAGTLYWVCCRWDTGMSSLVLRYWNELVGVEILECACWRWEIEDITAYSVLISTYKFQFAFTTRGNSKNMKRRILELVQRAHRLSLPTRRPSLIRNVREHGESRSTVGSYACAKEMFIFMNWRYHRSPPLTFWPGYKRTREACPVSQGKETGRILHARSYGLNRVRIKPAILHHGVMLKYNNRRW